jgi:mono/diheme cytochrome c family protein
MPVRVSRIPVALSFLVWGACVAPETEPLLTAAEPAAITFEQHVRPILKTHCFHCHGEEDEVQGNLDVRLVRLLVAGGDSGPALVKGKAAESLLLQRIEQGEMPPGGKKLADAELRAPNQPNSVPSPTKNAPFGRFNQLLAQRCPWWML